MVQMTRDTRCADKRERHPAVNLLKYSICEGSSLASTVAGSNPSLIYLGKQACVEQVVSKWKGWSLGLRQLTV